jgi:DNA-binding NarL/FixJ family response regulator
MSIEKPSRGRVLLADDDAAVLRPTSIALRKAGFEVDVVATGNEAAEALSKNTYDALVADINMPGNERLELAQVRREGQAMVPVILMTGYPSLETAVGALRYGVIDYITKPIDPEELFVRVDGAVSRGRALRALDDTRQRAAALIEAVGALESVVRLSGVPDPSQSSDSPSVAHRDPLERLPAHELSRLSPRERDVVRLLAVGHPVQAVAKTLGLSTNTVRNHVKSVFAKLRVRSQVALLGKLAGHPSPDDAR